MESEPTTSSLIHVSTNSNLRSIRERGILSPASAEQISCNNGIGSKGSNRSVVQLLDFSGASPAEVKIFLKCFRGDFGNAGISLRDITVLRISPKLRAFPTFLSHEKVKQRAREAVPHFRYVPHFEVWNEETISSTMISGELSWTEWERSHA